MISQRLVVIFLLILSIKTNLIAQVDFKIEEIKLSNFIRVINDEEYLEGESDGPYISVKCTIKNMNYDVLTLHPSKSKISLCFNYQGEEFNVVAEAMPFTDNENLFLNRNDSVNFRIRSHLLLGTSLWKENRTDYTIYLLELLPTLSVKYKDLENEYVVHKIKRVVVIK